MKYFITMLVLIVTIHGQELSGLLDWNSVIAPAEIKNGEDITIDFNNIKNLDLERWAVVYGMIIFDGNEKDKAFYSLGISIPPNGNGKIELWIPFEKLYTAGIVVGKHWYNAYLFNGRIETNGRIGAVYGLPLVIERRHED